MIPCGKAKMLKTCAEVVLLDLNMTAVCPWPTPAAGLLDDFHDGCYTIPQRQILTIRLHPRVAVQPPKETVHHSTSV